MSRRIEIELTSARPDGSWTWRAAGAQKPKGVLDGALLPAGVGTGSVLRADAEFELDGITILSVSASKEKSSKGNVLEILPSDKPFEEVTQQLARRERSDRGDRGDRRDRPPRRNDGDRPDRGPRRDGPQRTGEAKPAGSERGSRPDRGPRPDRKPRPHFEAPPELPQRPKAKRLRPGRKHRNAVLADLPEAQRMVAERAVQGGLPAVRQAVNEQNARLKSEGKEEIPAAGLLAMAEQLLPRLRVAEWLDRADAALADIDELDLRDLRSVVAAAEDPMVARDEGTRDVAAKLKEGLAAKQEKELLLWFGDIDAAVGVGRVVRALKLSSQPPKAGVRFPVELAGKLAAAATANLTADALPDRWVAVLEAAAFSPVRSHVNPTTAPTQTSDELLATVKRLAISLPQIAALFGVEASAGAAPPKPLRPTRPVQKKSARSIPAPPPSAPAAPAIHLEPVADDVTETPVTETESTETESTETESAETESTEAILAEPAHAETLPAEAEAVAAPVAEVAPVEESVDPAPAESSSIEAG